jgi:hypothetical protein
LFAFPPFGDARMGRIDERRDTVRTKVWLPGSDEASAADRSTQ